MRLRKAFVAPALVAEKALSVLTLGAPPMISGPRA